MAARGQLQIFLWAQKNPSRFANAWSQIKQMCNFHPLEVVVRGRETQLHVG